MFRPVIAVPVPEGPRTELRLCIRRNLSGLLLRPLLKSDLPANFARGTRRDHRLTYLCPTGLRWKERNWGKRPVHELPLIFESKLETRGW